MINSDPLHEPSAAPAGSTGGFTFIELVAGLVLIVVISGPLLKLFVESSRAYTAEAARGFTIVRSHQAMDRIAEELMFAAVDITGLDGNDQAPVIDYFPITGFAGSTPVYGDRRRIELFGLESNMADGIDNNGNGLVDEAQLVLWEDRDPVAATAGQAYTGTLGTEDTSQALCRCAVAGGLRITVTGNLAEIDFSFQTFSREGDLITTDFEIKVELRNPVYTGP